jgi:hypothetical protein
MMNAFMGQPPCGSGCGAGEGQAFRPVLDLQWYGVSHASLTYAP